MKIIAAKCKVCKKDLALQIADGYDEDHDPHNLLVYATCNSCFDLMIERRKIHDLVARLCRIASVLNPPGSLKRKEIPMELKDSFIRAAKLFSAWCARLLRRQHAANAGELAEKLIKKPDNWLGFLFEFEEKANES
jgi:hypothetical protein